ncbi:MAG: alpha/beta hydrolase domain-containing protein [Dehalococcoidia bacterium]
MTTVQVRPIVTGPITGGRKGWPFGASLLKVSEYGYAEEEYFLEGTAKRYRLTPNAELSPDGNWNVEPAGESPYRTRMLVYRPSDASRFNGTVVLTWNNVSFGHDLFDAESLELIEGGFALVCLTTQKLGVEGLAPEPRGLANWDPERYGSLSIPHDDYSFDIFSQCAAAVGKDRARTPVDPLGGLDVRRVVAHGISQGAGRLATYVNAIQPRSRALDGFILAEYFGSGAPLEAGDAVVHIYLPQTGRRQRLRATTRLREDLGVPIFLVNSEMEALACHSFRQPDTDGFRCWEAAGTCHVSTQMLRAFRAKLTRDNVGELVVPEGINRVPLPPLFDAAFHHMHCWLADGLPPPSQPKLEIAGDPAEVVRDEHGIAKGGVRLPQVEVPLAQNTAIPRSDEIFEFLGGSSRSFPREKVLALYGTKANFLRLFGAAAQRAVEAGVLLQRDVPALVAEASADWPE